MTTTTRRAAKLPTAALPVALLSLAACAWSPVQPVVEQLDTVTGTTLIVLAQPVELVTQKNRGPGLDPFAFIAPFETDRMGERALYLWVSTPQDKGPAGGLEVLCDGAPLVLPRLNARPAGVSRGPYSAPAPWSFEHYFSLPESSLQCLASARSLTVTARLGADLEDRFDSDPAGLKALAGFAAHHAHPL